MGSPTGRPRGKSGYNDKGDSIYGGREAFGPERPKATSVVEPSGVWVFLRRLRAWLLGAMGSSHMAPGFTPNLE